MPEKEMYSELYRVKRIADDMPSFIPVTGDSRYLLKRGSTYAIRGESGIVNRILHLIAYRIISLCGGDVIWVDGGNAFDPYVISELAQKCGRNPSDVLSRISIARAFTAHQMNSISMSALALSQVRDVSLLAVTGITDMFTTEIRWSEGKHLLKTALQRFNDLTRGCGCWSVTTAGRELSGNVEMEYMLSHNVENVITVNYSDGVIEIDSADGFSSSGRWNSGTYQRSLLDYTLGAD
ncbi:MAG: hypothetical protein M1117_04045 [Candidatus Thermoplasmatota archaeon]|uniref:Rad51-like C-terminal domain-containing protein n=1 Tax=Candidatus Sysuiplasma superficiale TaxID=2823368 RepID=A0A8J8CBN4_9ARCH|nr:hypothetical protein [Candidatus Sysuiplasma superficiale]MCL4347069.1 hypothetical protein [Candidatus Thermoplasmatota archaeon]